MAPNHSAANSLPHSRYRVGQPFNPYRPFTGIFIPEALARYCDVSPTAKLAYGRLVRCAGEDGRCFPSVKALARKIGVQERRARACLAELEAAGFIRRKIQPGLPGSPSSHGGPWQATVHRYLERRRGRVELAAAGGPGDGRLQERHCITRREPAPRIELQPSEAHGRTSDLHSNRLHFGVLLQAVFAEFAADSGLFESAERRPSSARRAPLRTALRSEGRRRRWKCISKQSSRSTIRGSKCRRTSAAPTAAMTSAWVAVRFETL
jgi:hypothetical protein